jgi:AcrR family transcriptional regulator
MNRLVCFNSHNPIFALSFCNGYETKDISTGINQVIKEAAVAKASFYQHFPSKEDLLLAYLVTTQENTDKEMRAQIAKCKTPREQVLALFDFLSKLARQTSFKGCNFLNIAAELPNDQGKVRSIIRKQKNGIRNLFAEILKPAGKEDLADEIYLLFDAALVSGKVYADVWPVKTARKIVEKLI